jgi:hypothetical protein
MYGAVCAIFRKDGGLEFCLVRLIVGNGVKSHAGELSHIHADTNIVKLVIGEKSILVSERMTRCAIVSYKIAGIDVHKKVLMVVIVDASTPEQKPERRQFVTLPSELRRHSLWLREQGVKDAVLELTAQYWRSVRLELEPCLRLHLAQAFSNRGFYASDPPSKHLKGARPVPPGQDVPPS